MSKKELRKQRKAPKGAILRMARAERTEDFMLTVQPVGTAWVKIVLARIFIHRFPLRERPYMSKKELRKQRKAPKGAILRMARLNGR